MRGSGGEGGDEAEDRVAGGTRNGGPVRGGGVESPGEAAGEEPEGEDSQEEGDTKKETKIIRERRDQWMKG